MTLCPSYQTPEQAHFSHWQHSALGDQVAVIGLIAIHTFRLRGHVQCSIESAFVAQRTVPLSCDLTLWRLV